MQTDTQTRAWLACLFLTVMAGAGASAGEERPLADRNMWRFESDNDLITESDDQFSAGWSLQMHSPTRTAWDDAVSLRLSRWIADHVPGLSEREGRYLKKGIGLGQIIQTPDDLSQTELIEDDVPYAGTLGLANSWYALNDRSLNAFQVYVGVVGPASLAEDLQKFVHNDLGLGEDPKGWDNQLNNEPLLNLNYAYKYKLAASGGASAERGWGGDLAVAADAGLGNLFTMADLALEGRFGWRLPRGFVHIPDPLGRGIIMNPVLETADQGMPIYFSAVLRGSAIAYTVLLDGNTFEDSHSVDYDPLSYQVIVGVHAAYRAFAFHWNLYYVPAFIDVSTENDFTWSNVSLEYAF